MSWRAVRGVFQSIKWQVIGEGGDCAAVVRASEEGNREEGMRISDFGLRIAEWGADHESRTTQKRPRQTNPNSAQTEGRNGIANHGPRITNHAKAYWPNEPIYGEGVVKPSVQEKIERSLRTSPSPSASVDLPHLSRLGGPAMMYLLPHIP